MAGFEDLFTEERRIPLVDASAYLVELMRPTDFPEPVRTPQVEAGLLKMAVVQDVFGNSPEGLAEAERMAMIDPEVQAAMDYAQLRRERDEYMQQNQGLAQQLQAAQQASQQAQQQMQSISDQASQLQQLLQNEQAQREQATIQAVQVKDQSLQEQMAAADKRQELFGLADGLKMQLDQLRAGADTMQQGIDQLQASAAEAPADMQMRQQQEQMAADQQAAQQQQQGQAQPGESGEGGGDEGGGSAEAGKKSGGTVTTKIERKEEGGQPSQGEQESQQMQQEGQQADETQKTASMFRKIAAVKRGKYGPEDRKKRQLLPENQMPKAPKVKKAAEESVDNKVQLTSQEKKQLFSIAGRALLGATTGIWVGTSNDVKLISGQMRKEGSDSASTKDSRVKAKKDEKNPEEGKIVQPANLDKVEKPAKEKLARLHKLAADVDKAMEIGGKLGVPWDRVEFTPADLAEGMRVEMEHNTPGVDVIDDIDLDPAKIALVHLAERPNYYRLLEKVEDAPLPDEGQAKIAGGVDREATEFEKGEGNVAALVSTREQKVSNPQITSGEGDDAIRKALQDIISRRQRDEKPMLSFLEPAQPAIKPEDRGRGEKVETKDTPITYKGEPTTIKKLAAVFAERLRRAARG